MITQLRIRISILFIGSFFTSLHAFSQAPPWSWGKSIGSSVANDYGTSVAIDALGNVYTTGGFSWVDADFDPGPAVFNLFSFNAEDIFVSKLDPNGDFVWAKAMGGMGNDNGNSIKVDASGNIYITGLFTGTVDFDPGTGVFNLTSANFSNDAFVCKLNSSGNFVWARVLGGANNDYAYALALDASANVYTTGVFSATADFDPGAGVFNLTTVGYNDIFISKLDSAGNFVWAKSMGGATYAWGQAITVDVSGNVLTTGVFANTVDFDPGSGTFNVTAMGGYDVFICRLDNSGNFSWAKALGESSMDAGYSISTDASGNVYTGGSFFGTVDFDPGAGTFNLTSAGNDDIFISKLSNAGNFVWAKTMGGISSDEARSLTVDASGNVYITGYYSETADFDPGAGTFSLTAIAAVDIFLCKLDNAGNFGWAKGIGGSNSDVANSIALSATGNAHITGYFYSTTLTVTSPLLNADTSAATNDIIIAKTDIVTAIDESENSDNEILFAPNPATNQLTVRSSGFGDENILTIYNILGEQVFSRQLKAKSMQPVTIDVSLWENGIYFFQNVSEKQRVRGKVVVQH